MKASELRIGNWVNYHDGGFFKVIGIHEFGLDVEDDIEKTYMEYENFEPIPLTEKWLLSFGFNKIVYDSEETGYGTEYELEINEVGFLSYLDDYSCALFSSKRNQKKELGVIPSFNNIKTVHGLQNLYFALTGIDLIKKQTK